jgi:hypothetical protein
MKRAFYLASILAAFSVLTMVNAALAQNQKGSESSETRTAVQKKNGQTVPKGASVIGHLESRDRIITVSKGPKGPLYTIKTKDGKILATRIDEKSLQAKYPDIYHQVKTGIAGNDARL